LPPNDDHKLIHLCSNHIVKMVKILSNGEIVPDDDPRAQQAQSRPQRPPQPHMAARQQQQEGAYHHGQQVSIFHSLNQKLHNMGIPPFRIGEIVIEPIVTVGFLFALLMFGIQGLIFGAVLFAVSQWSSNGAPEIVTRLMGNGGNGANNQGRTQGSNRSPNNRRGEGGGSGHRLGRN